MVTHHLDDALQMVVAFLGAATSSGGSSLLCARVPAAPSTGKPSRRKRDEIRRLVPERIPAIIVVKLTFHLPRDGLMFEHFGAALDLRLGQLHIELFILERQRTKRPTER